MKDLYHSIQEIGEYYQKVEQAMSRDRKRIFSTSIYQNQNGDSEGTERGVFAANTVDVFVDIILRGIMEQQKTSDLGGLEKFKLMDAGCGDSRSLAVGTLFHLDCYGLDLSQYLIDVSKRASTELHDKLIIPKEFKVTKGSYNSDESYKNLGISFPDIDFFLHSINSLSVFDLLKKFTDKAKDSAKLILLGGPGLIEFKNVAEEYGLSMSQLYSSKKSGGIQSCYAFLYKNSTL